MIERLNYTFHAPSQLLLEKKRKYILSAIASMNMLIEYIWRRRTIANDYEKGLFFSVKQKFLENFTAKAGKVSYVGFKFKINFSEN
ncbi:hypothetical protein HZS_6663 [Henneguya salminicola]|nr:hypothetical protein HZS_6663 [Henneguya salminicola]